MIKGTYICGRSLDIHEPITLPIQVKLRADYGFSSDHKLDKGLIRMEIGMQKREVWT